MSSKRLLKILPKGRNGSRPGGNFKDDIRFTKLIRISTKLAAKMQKINLNSRHLQREKANNTSFADRERKAQNRTKIQMGGLVLKSGLADLLGIIPGADLQLDEQYKEKAVKLLGALITATETLLHDKGGEVLDTWIFKGQKALQQQNKERAGKER